MCGTRVYCPCSHEGDETKKSANLKKVQEKIKKCLTWFGTLI